ncbi:hypothetical protein TanjilG_12731 [Lupinus angustifolius]|uniref:Uncharacterized protein n=1 Tax=Lupinus angustifolius TaxID=3871 RepID=A0A1J7FNR9_LUPAN|nr:hypothetical protein TanjilG_12731 [Lupinus angustifolius]
MKVCYLAKKISLQENKGKLKTENYLKYSQFHKDKNSSHAFLLIEFSDNGAILMGGWYGDLMKVGCENDYDVSVSGWW